MAESVAGYPVRALRIAAGGPAVEVLVVARLEDYVDGEALLRDAAAPEPPYWMHLWPGSRALARLVGAQSGWRGRRVVEVGCGLGLPGIVAASRGARVLMLDAALDAVRFARANAARNGCAIAACQADIARPPLRGSVDVVLAADTTYDPVLQRALAALLAAHLAPNGRAWCAESVRTVDRGLSEECRRLGLDVREWEVRESDEQGEVPVRLTEVWRP